MKLKLLDTKGKEKGSAEFPVSETIRPDLIKRAVEAFQSRNRQPYGADPRAGKKHSTRVSKKRRDYRGSYGKGISRVPRKILNRSGSQMYWVGAMAPGMVGGRRAHPPKSDKKWVKKINKKENRKAINSAMVAALDKQAVTARGHRVPDSYPFGLAADFDKLDKTKEVITALGALGLGPDLQRGANGAKTVLIVTESEALAKAAKNISGVDVSRASELNAHILAPGSHPGRATLFTESSLKALSGEKVETPKAKKTTAKKTASKKSSKKPKPKATKKAKGASA